MSSLLRYKKYTSSLSAASLLWLPFAVLSTEVEVLKDPTMPLLSTFQGKAALDASKESSEEQISLLLQAIILKSGQKFAVINGQVLSEGKHIEGYEVTSIEGDQVLLNSEEEALSLTLHKVNIKTSNE